MTPPLSNQPFAPRSAFLRTLAERGFIHQCTDLAGLDARFCAGPVIAYNGFDLTADSLHVGHLIPIMMLRWLQKTGHKPVVLAGGGTTRIGDPSFRDTSRPLLDGKQIAANLSGIRRVFDRFLVFGEGPTDAVMVDNAEWLDHLGYIDFLRDFGQHFSINQMLTFDSVRQRLEREQSLSLLEFNKIRRDALEQSVLNGLRTHLMEPELFREFCEEFTREVNRLRMDHRAELVSQRRELERTERDLDRAVQAILDGVPGSHLKAKIETLKARKAELTAILAEANEPPPLLHPNLAEVYRQQITALHEKLQAEETRAEAAAIVLRGDLAAMPSFAAHSKKPSLMGDGLVQGSLVAGTGFEPVTFRL